MILSMISAIDDVSDKEFMLDLYNKYHKLIRKTIYKVVRNANDTEDLTNDTFIKLIEKISTIRGLTCHKMIAYIVYTSKNIAINYIKHKDVIDKHIYYGLENDMADDFHDISMEIEEKLLHQTDVELLSKAIKMLPEAQKDILYFKYFLDMKDEDIAKTIGVSQGSVRQYVKRARDAAKLLIGTEADTYAKR